MLGSFTIDIMYGYALIFCRLGAVMLFVPGLGESYVSPRSRLFFALLLSAIVYPMISEKLPGISNSVYQMAVDMINEIIIGLFIGLVMRVIQSATHIAGMEIAMMSGLSTAMIFDQNQSTQGSVVGGFLSVSAITLFFTSGLHLEMIEALVESFFIFAPAKAVDQAFFANTMVEIVSQTFVIAFKISLPITAVGLMLYVAAGLMSRLMPSMQVFFVLMPIQLLAAFFVLALALSGMLLVYISFFEDKILSFFG